MRVAVVGSGPTGVGAARILTARGIGVDLFDGGRECTTPAETRDLLAEAARSGRAAGMKQPPNGAPVISDLLRRTISARRLRKAVLGSDFVFEGIEAAIPLQGGWLPRSLAVGGLSNVWGTACYPLRAEDRGDWPLAPGALDPWYSEAAALMHLSAERDGLASVLPLHAEPADLSDSDWQRRQAASGIEGMLRDWRDRSAALAAMDLAAGRARLALRRGSGAEDCTGCAGCMAGCPIGAMWTSAPVLAEMARSAGLVHRSGGIVRRIEAGTEGEFVQAGAPGAGEERHGPYAAVFLAAGPVSSLRIAGQSLGRGHAAARLVDNDIYVVPFLMDGHRHSGEPTFQLSEAAVAIGGEGRPAHLQLYRPSGPLTGPLGALASRLPQLGRLLDVFLGRLVLGFLYLHSAESRALSLEIAETDAPFAALRLTARDTPAAGNAARRVFGKLRQAREGLGLRPLTALALRGDPGLSGHIGGTLPMRARPGALETGPDGRLAGDRPIYVADLSVFPEMPAQNPTFTGVANAMRIAAGYAERRRAA